MNRGENKDNLETLLSIAYCDKKLSKNVIKNIDINLIIENTDSDKLNLNKLSIILIALSKILQKRMKGLVEDASHIYQILCRCPTKRAPRASSTKNITLNIENNKLFINDEMLNFQEDVLIEELEKSILECSIMNPEFEVDFGDAPSIEQVRNSTEMSSVLFNDVSLNINVKRRKIVEDTTIEISENIFRCNLRSVNDILMKPKQNVIDLNNSFVKIDSKIHNFLESLKRNVPVVEEQRNQEFEVDFQANDFSLNPVEMEKTDIVGWESSLFNIFNDISALPENFNFNLLIQQLSKEEKANSFFSLLALSSQGTVVSKQNEPFESIEVNLLKNSI